jgi:hypothetical protein
MKTLLLITIGFFCALKIQAQESKTLLGVDLSSTIRSLYGNKSQSDNVVALGYGAGLTFQYKLKKRFSMISGLGYEKKGDISEETFRDTEGLLIGTTKYRSNYNYLTMPVMASVTNAKGNLYAAGGPYLGYLISRIDKTDAVGAYAGRTQNLTEYSKRIDFGWSMEFGYKIRLGNRMNIDLGIRDNLGLLNTTKGELKIKNNSLGIRVGFSCGL